MKSLLLVVIASSVCLSGVSKGDNHHNHRILKRNPAAKRGRISTSPKPSGRSHEEAYHYIIETSYRNHNDDAKKKRKHKILEIPTEEDYQIPYQNYELYICSVHTSTKEKQLDIPGCGGWVKLACPGGCLAILKVKRYKYFYWTQVSLGSDLWVLMSVRHSHSQSLCRLIADVTLANKDINSIPTNYVNRAIPGIVAMQVAPPGGQN